MLIAEISSNHNKDLDRCLQFVEQAKQCGFDAIKLQIFKIDKLFISEVLEKSKMHASRVEWEFPIEFLQPIKQKCDELNLKLGVTPFYIDAVTEAEQYVDFFKVASYELLWKDLHNELIKTNKPVIISTGMATMEEIVSVKDLYAASEYELLNLTFLHCESNYPASYKTVNLRAINSMREILKTKVGWSDHTKDIDVVCAGIFQYGCDVVEMHFDLDGEGAEAAGGHCWMPSEVIALQEKINKLREIAGSGIKCPAFSEEDERLWRADPIDGLRPVAVKRNDLKL